MKNISAPAAATVEPYLLAPAGVALTAAIPPPSLISQMEFLNLLKNFIIEREKVEKKDLINAPFTIIHPQGIRGVFSPAEINEILQLTGRLAA